MEFPNRPFNKSGWPWDASSNGSATNKGNATLPRITIVTPSFNQAQFLEETIRSVLLQDYPNLEYIIIDGGSNDGSVEIIRKYGSWLAFWISEPDKGQAHAINKGFARATGKIMGYLNSDDVLAPQTLMRVANAFTAGKTHQDFVLTFAGAVLDHSGAMQIERPRQHQKLTSWLDTGHSLFQPSTYWSSFVYNRVGGFDESMTFSFDKDFFIRALFGFRSCHFIAVPEFVASWFRLHSSSKTSKLRSTRDFENQIIRDRYRSQEPYASILIRELKEEKHHKEVLRALSSSRFFTACLHLLRAMILMPEKAMSRFYLGACRRVFFKVFK